MKNSDNSLNTAVTNLDTSMSTSLANEKQETRVKFVKADEDCEIKHTCEEVKLLLDSKLVETDEPLDENILYYEGFPTQTPPEDPSVVLGGDGRHKNSFHVSCL